jgi:membrane protein
VREFREDNLTDWAAALTYYAILSLFPALIVLVALIGLLGQYPQTTNAILDIIDKLGPSSAVDTFRTPIEGVVKNKGGAGALLGVGLLAAMWSASGYIGAFTRASNAIYEVQESRSFWKLRPLQVLITLIAVVLVGLLAIALVLTGDLARAVGDEIGVGDTAVSAWSIAKWPVLLIIVMTIISGLYYIAPNVRQPGFRWITPGGVIAVVLWILASAGFALYVSHFGSYNKTYGSLGAVIVFLIWLWITNIAILFGAEFNSELERSRQIEAGVPGADSVGLGTRSEPVAK